ncbi:hypothetical protein ACO2Q9_02795 [Variovorax sp. VNK109]|uniref:hypothetical protein n=1 Tax=Variovorax sp. VNK109 TaxID=3400919 RepID=UPI003C10BA62
MHAFTPGPFPLIFWISAIVLGLACLSAVICARFFGGPGALGVMFLSIAIAVIAAVVSIVSGGAWWFLV